MPSLNRIFIGTNVPLKVRSLKYALADKYRSQLSGSIKSVGGIVQRPETDGRFGVVP